MKEYLQNLHTHTIYDDGKDTPESIVQRAIELGFDTIGFSGHSYMYFAPSIGMTPEATIEYNRVVRELKQKYADRISVLCGLEYEMLSDVPHDGYDYLIGSTHYLKINGEIVGIDRDAATVENVINTYFNGNGLRYAEAFFEATTHLHEYGNFDIVGHYDLLNKHCEKTHFFDVESSAYQKIALDAIHEITKHFHLFEVNTGAIARGYRTTPYPLPFMLKELKRLGCEVCISSDCHDRMKLNEHFGACLDLIQSCGFTEVTVMTKNGFKGVKIG